MDDEISDFADDPYLINVAVSRAKKKLMLVVTGNEQSKERNITDLIDYIQYNNFEVTESKIYSIFDYLYKQYTEERRVYLQKHKKVSEYDSENLMYSLIEDIISDNKYSSLDVVCHFPLNMLIKNPELLNEQECQYAMNPATHLDFLIYNRIGKKPVLAIEVDGYEYHKEDTIQASSERRFYQKITDIYATAVDYDKNSQVTREFYATVQNKMHYAVHGNTVAEVIVARADHNKKYMGLKSWKNAPDGKIVKTDVSIAKNYLEKEELAELNEIVTMYLDYATRQARRHIPMTMEDWKTKLDAFLRFNDAEVLQDKGKVTAAIAKEFAESEFEKYRVIQDSLYESDFDKLMNDMEKDGTND